MTHDFAKIRPEPILERKPSQTPPAWSMLITGMLVGIALGVFASVLFYLSGRVPPLQATPTAPIAASSDAESAASDGEESAVAAAKLELEFYHELPNYEVAVDATPVEITDDPSDPMLDAAYLLQSGAFQQQELAEQELRRQRELGLDARVKTEVLTGRTLYLIQSGPYRLRRELRAAEQLLRRNNISSLRSRVQ